MKDAPPLEKPVVTAVPKITDLPKLPHDFTTPDLVTKKVPVPPSLPPMAVHTDDQPPPPANETQEKFLLAYAKQLFAATGNNKSMYIAVMEREIGKLNNSKAEVKEFDFQANRARMMQSAAPGTNAWRIRNEK